MRRPPWRRAWLPTPVFWRIPWTCIVHGVAESDTTERLALSLSLRVNKGFPGGASGKEPSANAGDIRCVGLIPGSGRSPAEGNGNPLQHAGL